jgi:hypothetical protein
MSEPTRRLRRDATGCIVQRRLKDGTIAYGLRFKVPTGEKVYETLGRSDEGCDKREAEARAERILAMVKLGTYRTKAELEQECQERQAERETVPTSAPTPASGLSASASWAAGAATCRPPAKPISFGGSGTSTPG